MSALKKPRCALKMIFPTNSVTRSAETPTPGPSGEQLRPKSLVDDLKTLRASKAQDAKNRSKRKVLAEVQPMDTGVPNPVIENTIDESDKDVKTSSLNVRKRKICLPPSSEAMQVPEPPSNPVSVEIEVIRLTPESNTSTTKPVSDISSLSYDIDVDIEREFTEPDDSGSEVEMDNPVDISLRPRNVSEYPPECDDLDDPILAEGIKVIGDEADVALRALADPDDCDSLCFDWCSDIKIFEGAREIFTGPSGPTFEVSGLSPLAIFKKILDDDIIERIVRETNRYAHQIQMKGSKMTSRMSRWRDTTAEEIWRFFTIIMLQSFVVNNVEREYWYPMNEQLRIGDFGTLMAYNRFVLLKKCLHFVDNTILPENPSKLDKIMPIIRHLNKQFSSLYLPEQNVAIDESLLLWKGRLSFAQLIATKRAKVGLKSYELCESRTGYLWRMEVYSGKGHVHEPQDEQIVYHLMRPLFGKGHTVIMDNFYNAPLLSRLLKKYHKTDTMGTLRLNREFVPEALKSKTKKNMKPGEVSFSTTKDLVVVVWKDKNLVSMISTFHHPEVGGKEKYGYYEYKPKVVLDYNLSMGGIDHKNQMLHAFPVERVRNSCWYKKLFRRLLNVSVHNSLVMYNHGRIQPTEVGNRDFRLQLVGEMLERYSPRATRPKSPPPAALSELHLPAKNNKSQRCKLCHESKVRRTTVWSCSTCKVNLCIEGCYTAYHAKYICKK